jgi:hypothetical protein
MPGMASGESHEGYCWYRASKGTPWQACSSHHLNKEQGKTDNVVLCKVNGENSQLVEGTGNPSYFAMRLTCQPCISA